MVADGVLWLEHSAFGRWWLATLGQTRLGFTLAQNTVVSQVKAIEKEAPTDPLPESQ